MSGESTTSLAIDAAELDLMEKRVADIERYLGIDDLDPESFRGPGALETLDQKAKRLDDFVKVIEDKHYIMGELFGKYDHLEGLLRKDGGSLRSQHLPALHLKTAFISDCEDTLNNYVGNLEEAQKLEQYLNFEPLIDVPEKVAQLRTLNASHARDLIACQKNA